MPVSQNETAARYGAAVVMTCAMLALWGFAQRFYATLLPDLAKMLAMSNQQTDIARVALAIGYFVMALPAAFVSRNFGYKIGALLGLGIFAVGMFLFYPAMETRSFVFVLLAATVIGSGLALVQVTTAPLIVCLGPRHSAIQRLTLVQSLAPIGAIAGLLLALNIRADIALHPEIFTARNLVLPISFVGVAAIAMAFIVEMVNFPPVANTLVARHDSTLASFLPLLKLAKFRFGIYALVLSLFAQAVVAGCAIRYCTAAMPGLTPQMLRSVLVMAFTAFTLGHLAGPALMTVIAPMRVLVLFCAASAVAAATTLVASGWIGIGALVATAFFLSIQMPAIVAYSIRDFGDNAKSATALMMFFAFSGTALFAVLTLLLHPPTSSYVMILPTLSLCGVTVYAVALLRYADEDAPLHASKAHAAATTLRAE